MRKRLSGLWPHLIDLDNLYRAYRKARRGKQHKPAVARFSLNLESELLALHRELSDGTLPLQQVLFVKTRARMRWKNCIIYPCCARVRCRIY